MESKIERELRLERRRWQRLLNRGLRDRERVLLNRQYSATFVATCDGALLALDALAKRLAIGGD